jgi:hypothetical protein
MQAGGGPETVTSIKVKPDHIAQDVTLSHVAIELL